MGEKSKVKLDGTLEVGQVVSYLENIASGLKAGLINVQLGGESVSLTPPSVVDLEMEVSQKKDKEKLTIELCWKKGAGQDVNISSSAPRIEVS